MDAPVIDVRLSLGGGGILKVFHYAANDNSMQWAAPAELPTMELAKKHKWIILFLDEMNPSSGGTSGGPSTYSNLK